LALCLLLASTAFRPTPAIAIPPPVPPDALLGVAAAILYDFDNDRILFEQQADVPIPPASLTKILSMYLALDYVRHGYAKLTDNVHISRAAASAKGSKMGLRVGEQVHLGELLMGMAVSSGNDASVALAEFIGGSKDAFVAMMNAKAASLGMHASHFATPNGLPAPGQVTTARDMLTLARAYLRAHPNALGYHSREVLSYRGQTTWNKNPLLGQYDGADGLKTGWIRDSGYNLIVTVHHGGRRLIAVIMGAPTVRARGAEACRLLDAGFLVLNGNARSVSTALPNMPVPIFRLDPWMIPAKYGLQYHVPQYPQQQHVRKAKGGKGKAKPQRRAEKRSRIGAGG
jgi:D-alanyl-D-alanine carboxypeptidase (penicillin-binding protein 5/6)